MPPRNSGIKGEKRACLVCSIIQLKAEFLSDGCPNCEEILDASNGSVVVVTGTSGLIRSR